MRRDPFQAAADPNRRKIIEILAKEGTLTMNQLAAKFDISRPAVSKHVKILQKSGLIEIRQVRVERFCSLNAEGIKTVFDWASQYRPHWEKEAPAATAKPLTKKKAKEEPKAEPKPKPKPKASPKKPAKKAPSKTKKQEKSNDKDERDQLSLF